MEIVLLQNVKTLGKAGEIKEVKRGYATNFLIPKGLALPAEEGFIKEAQIRARKVNTIKEVNIDELKELITKIEGLEIVFNEKVTKEGKLYGSVGAGDIAEKISEKIGAEFDEKYIKIDKAIKELGEYDIKIDLGEGIESDIKIKIEEEK